MNYLEEYYNNYNEEGRLLSRHGQVEYLTTMRYIRECLNGLADPEILEIGAGTGALDLSAQDDNRYDLTMLLGPMYHLYTKEDQLRALSEAVRVTKPGGRILVAYCMNEPTVIMYVFGLNKLHETMDLKMLTEDWHCISEPKDLFQLMRTEDIAALNREVPVERIKLAATDGATNYMRDLIDKMDDETFGKWLDFHFTICERQDLIGASHHTLDMLRKLPCCGKNSE